MCYMTKQIKGAIENRQESITDFLRDALLIPVSKEKLSFVLLPIVNELKYENYICGKVAEMINDSLSDYSLGIGNAEDTLRECENRISMHYERMIVEILSDLSTIRTESDVARERRKIDYKVQFGYIDPDIASLIKSFLELK